jgi:hypothetical protein
MHRSVFVAIVAGVLAATQDRLRERELEKFPRLRSLAEASNEAAERVVRIVAAFPEDVEPGEAVAILSRNRAELCSAGPYEREVALLLADRVEAAFLVARAPVVEDVPPAPVAEDVPPAPVVEEPKRATKRKAKAEPVAEPDPALVPDSV